MVKRVKKIIWEDTFTADRSWGVEYWIENLDDYCGKVLLLQKNHKCSLHYHIKKLETMYLQSGQVNIRFRDPSDAKDYTVKLYPGDSIRIPRGQQHQIIALEDSTLIEFSTKHEEEDSYRVEAGGKLED